MKTLLFGLLFLTACTETIVQPVVIPPDPPEKPVATFIYDKPQEGDPRVVPGFVRTYSTQAVIGSGVCLNGSSMETEDNPVTATYTVHIYYNSGSNITQWDETVSATYSFTQDTTITL